MMVPAATQLLQEVLLTWQCAWSSRNPAGARGHIWLQRAMRIGLSTNLGREVGSWRVAAVTGRTADLDGDGERR
jgi:hypothetical protein